MASGTHFVVFGIHFLAFGEFFNDFGSILMIISDYILEPPEKRPKARFYWKNPYKINFDDPLTHHIIQQISIEVPLLFRDPVFDDILVN